MGEISTCQRCTPVSSEGQGIFPRNKITPIEARNVGVLLVEDGEVTSQILRNGSSLDNGIEWDITGRCVRFLSSWNCTA